MSEEINAAQRSVRLLHLEDDPRDAELIRRRLDTSGLACDIRWVDRGAAFEATLRSEAFDLVLADYNLPDYDGMSAIRTVRAERPELPVIIISGSVNEEEAVECLKAGANDYVLKQRLQRLGTAVTRALEEAEQRRTIRQAEASLRESEIRFRTLASVAPVGILRTDPDGNCEFVNERWLEMAGMRFEEACGPGWMRAIHPEDRERVTDAWQRAVRDAASFESEYRLCRPDGKVTWVMGRAQPETAVAGKAAAYVGTITDLTDRKQQEERIARLSRIQAVLSGINAAIVRGRDRQRLLEEACEISVRAGGFRMAWVGFVDPQTLEVKPVARAGHEDGYLSMIRPSADPAASGGGGITGRAIREKRHIILDVSPANTGALMREEAIARGYRSAISLPLTVEGEVVGVLCIYAAETGVFDAEEVRLLRDVASDVSFALDYFEKQKRIDYLALYDALTGLPNRSLFYEDVAQAIRAAQRSNSKAVLVEFNVERFRLVNNTLGRHAGDLLLKLIAERVRGLESDYGRPARVGADTFAMILSGAEMAGDIAYLVESRLLEPLQRPFQIAETELRIAIRCGVALFPDDGVTVDALFTNAEAALAGAKGAGRRLRFYEPEMNAQVAERLTLESKLRTALERKEFVLHYQPKFDAVTGTLSGLEALIRWADPASGLVPPVTFIPILEETGMILEVGRWALEQALSDRRGWIGENLAPPRIAVNVSAVQLHQKDFVETVRQVLGAPGGGDAGLDLEITESVLMSDIEECVGKLNALRKMGIGVHIDDFGTGYSSLSYIARLPINFLKIDGSFVRNMADPAAMAIVSAILSVARSLKLSVVAEGVETVEQQQSLIRLGCNQLQGYLLGRPMPAEKIREVLGERKMAPVRKWRRV